MHLFIAVLSLIGAGLFFCYLRTHWLLLLLTGVFTFLYTAPKAPFMFAIRLRKIAYGKTIFLAFAWAHVTVILPFLLSGINWQQQHFVYLVQRFLFIYAICILFDLRDREADKKEGIKSLVTYLSPYVIDKVYYSVLAAYLFTTLLLHTHFSATVLFGLLFPALILLICYRWFKQHTTDFVYYVLIDGLLVFSLPLLLLFGF